MIDKKDVRERLQQAIQEEDDPKFRRILSLLQFSIEHIGSRLDEVLTNETRLREAVLNGTAENHDTHHDWIEHWRNRDTEVREAFAWVAEKRRFESENKSSARKIIEGASVHIVTVAGGGLLGYFLAHLK